MDGGSQASKRDASAFGEVVPCEPEMVRFNCKFHENAMRGAGDAMFTKAPLSRTPSRMKPIYLDDEGIVPEELKMACPPENSYIAGDLGRQGDVFSRALGVKPTLKSQPVEPKDHH
ncbi:hypothetical protein V5799_007012 [Amblyomma americanum]|uniref:Uncharacterized protein n=1 Tax=Amblyomma americanum TaxID=6943 RepID=A0AAQ4DUR3_AMBAM